MNIKKLMKQAQKMQKEMEETMSNLQVEGSAGGGVVKLSLNGKKELLSLHLSEEILSPDNREMVEDLLMAAWREASEKVDQELAQLMAGMGSLPFA